jgi:hypothetical protein
MIYKISGLGLRCLAPLSTIFQCKISKIEMYTSIVKELLLQRKKSQLESKKNVFIEFISNLDIFSLFSPRDIVIIKEMTFDTENYECRNKIYYR